MEHPERGSRFPILDLGRIACVATLLAIFVRTFIAVPLHVPTDSMVPALLPGDHVLVDRLASIGGLGLLPGDGLPRRGDILVLRAPDPPTRLVVKRCVALPGERIERRAGRLLVDGRVIDAPWADRVGADFAPVWVGPDQLFVLGDHPSASIDSRRWGAVSTGSRVGRVTLIYWSTASPERVGWDRLDESFGTRLSLTRWDRILRPVR